MHDVSSMNLKCATCGTEIKELPFQPDGSKPVYCSDCNRKRQGRTGGSGGGGGGGYRGGSRGGGRGYSDR